MHTVPSDFTSSKVQTTTQADRLQREAEAAERAAAEREKKEKRASSAAAAAAKKVGEGAHAAGSENPVVLGNAILAVGLSSALGFGAYHKYASGQLTWGVVGTWAGVVGLVAVGDYYVSQ